MSDKEALKLFSRTPVNSDMIHYLVSTTNSIIQVKTYKPKFTSLSTSDILVSPVSKKHTSLAAFIKTLIKYSNVQTPTLMATLIYLNKLRSLLPANAVGMETTRHRIFLAALILSAKSLNDSSPLNKHWTKYTDGLLTIDEVNMAERELIGLLKWDITIKEEDLIIALQPFLLPIKTHLQKKLRIENSQKIVYYRLSNAYASVSNSRSSSTSSISSYGSVGSADINSLSSNSSYDLTSLAQEKQRAANYTYRPPLHTKNVNVLNRQIYSPKKHHHEYGSVSAARIIA